MTNAEFARHCAYLSSLISQWGGGSLVLPETVTEDMGPIEVARFTNDIRSRLDVIDHIANRGITAGETD